MSIDYFKNMLNMMNTVDTEVLTTINKKCRRDDVEAILKKFEEEMNKIMKASKDFSKVKVSIFYFEDDYSQTHDKILFAFNGRDFPEHHQQQIKMVIHDMLIEMLFMLTSQFMQQLLAKEEKDNQNP